MTNYQYYYQYYNQQNKIRRKAIIKRIFKILCISIITIVMFIGLCYFINHNQQFKSEISTTTSSETPSNSYNNSIINNLLGEISDEDKHLLAKITMAEAGVNSTHVKALVIFVVFNRVLSDEFPDTIKEVILQEYKGIYQFTPAGNGRLDKAEPDEDCWEALKIVMETSYDFSNGALYFEDCENPDNWHSRNLELICEYEGMRFYK